MSSKNYYIISLLLFAVYFVNGIIEIPRLSITGDESDHLSYAIRFLKRQPEKVRPFDDASTMPISAFNAIPRAVQQVVDPSLKKNDWGQSDVFAGRYMTLLLSVLIGFFILKCSTELYGRKAGLLSLFLFVFCPNLNGHAVLVTTDAYSALFTLTSAWYFRKAILANSWKNLLLFGLHLGLAQLAKQSLTHLFFIYSLLFIFYLAKGIIRLKFRAVISGILFVIFIVLLVINIGFQFHGTGMPLHEYHFRSSFFNGFQHRFSFMGSLPLPLPEPYLSGLDLTKNIDEIGPGRPESSGSVYLLGQYRDGTGFWYYYFVVLFFKTPLPVIGLSILFLIRSLKERKRSFTGGFIFMAIIIYLLIYFSFFYNSQVGIRHIIMIFPLLYVLLGKVAEQLFKRKIVTALLAVYSISTFYYYFPNLIAYTNEMLLPKRNAYRVMGDSNIDYGQSYFWLQRYLKDHPDVHMAGTVPERGKLVVRIRDYLDLFNTKEYSWLRPFKPIAQVEHSYLLIDTRDADIKTVPGE